MGGFCGSVGNRRAEGAVSWNSLIGNNDFFQNYLADTRTIHILIPAGGQDETQRTYYGYISEIAKAINGLHPQEAVATNDLLSEKVGYGPIKVTSSEIRELEWSLNGDYCYTKVILWGDHSVVTIGVEETVELTPSGSLDSIVLNNSGERVTIGKENPYRILNEKINYIINFGCHGKKSKVPPESPSYIGIYDGASYDAIITVDLMIELLNIGDLMIELLNDNAQVTVENKGEAKRNFITVFEIQLGKFNSVSGTIPWEKFEGAQGIDCAKDYFDVSLRVLNDRFGAAKARHGG
jgi:hypothetical protein